MAKPDQQSTVYDPKTAGRFLLSAGDHFFIPPNNVYRMENHSRTTTVRLTFTIIKPMNNRI
jgi:hypothetical protein